jgi:hypothetical protein
MEVGSPLEVSIFFRETNGIHLLGSEYKLWQYESLGISPVGATLPNLDVWNGDLAAVQRYVRAHAMSCNDP